MKTRKTTHNLVFVGMFQMKGNFIRILTGLTFIELLGLVPMFLMVTLAYSGTLTDNFDDGDFEGWRRHKYGNPLDEWSVKDGELVVVSKDRCNSSQPLMTGDSTWGSYEFECQFKFEKTFPIACSVVGCGFGVHVNDVEVLNELNTIDLGVSSKDGVVWEVTCRKGINGQFQQLHKGKLAVKQGKWHTMRIVADGEKYEMFIDGKRICDFQTDLPDKGNVIVWGHNSEVHFDNVVITGDDIPDKDLGLPVEPKAKLTTTWAKIRVPLGK